MMMREFTCLALVVTLCACAGTSSRKTLTLADLPRNDVIIEPQALPTLSWQESQKEYQRVLEESGNQTLQVAARQRLSDLALEAGGAGQLEPSHSKPADDAAANITAAIAGYEQLLREFPARSGNDRVLYQLARAYDVAGKPSQVLASLSRLVNEYPASDYYLEAQFRSGELLFARGRFEESGKAYDAVLQGGEQGRYYRLALYKQAWSIYRHGETAQAQIAFSALLDHLAVGDSMQNVPAGERELVEDAFRVLSLSFSQEQGERSIAAFFDRIGHRGYLPLVYQRLAELYQRQKRFEDAARVFTAFAHLHADHAGAPSFLLRSIESYEEGGMSGQALTARIEFASRYAVGQDFWRHHDQALFLSLKPRIQDNLRHLSRHYHALAQFHRRLDDAHAAQHWYRTYLSSFPAETDTPHMHFLLAENLFEFGFFADAAQAYEQVAYQYPLHERSSEAGYAALLAHEQRMDVNPDLRSQALIASAARFVQTFPDDRRIYLVLHRQADEHYARSDYDAAAITAMIMLAEAARIDSALVIEAWGLVAQSEFELGNFVAAEVASRQAIAASGRDASRMAAHRERLAAAIYRQAEQAQRTGELAQAADLYLRVATEVPDASIRIQAEYDAAAAMIGLQEWERAAGVLENFVIRYPRHELQQGAREKLAHVYAEAGWHAKAAATYESLAALTDNQERTRDWLWIAARGYEKAGNVADAIRIHKRYLGNVPVFDAEAYELRHHLAALYEQQGDVSSQHHWLGQLLAHKDGIGEDPRLRHLVAGASLTLAQPAYERFQRARLAHPLKASLKDKKMLMQEAIQAYSAATEFGIAEVTTAATYHIARIYQEFGHALLESERPRDLDADELSMYVIMLEEQAFPFEEKAISLHEVNIARIAAGFYDRWIRESISALAELQPVRYRKLEQGVTWVATLY